MTRLILLLMLFAAAALALAGALSLLRALRAPVPPAETVMPATIRVTATVVLMLLLLGVATGWIGPA